jgi:protein gp37
MGENSNIEWCDHSLNPWISCQKVGPGCDFCYAEAMMDKRLGKVQWGPHGERVRTSAANWRKPLSWEKHAKHFEELHGRRQRVFCASLADWADTHKSILPEWRRDLGELIEATPNLDWLLLTKRIGNAREVLGEMFNHYGVPKNVLIGITVVNQTEADRDIPKLLDLKTASKIARVFLSIEPLLDEITLSGPFLALGGVDGIIVGGESGPNARPMHPDWARSLRDQCAAAEVPFHFKQWGEWLALDGPRWPSIDQTRNGSEVWIDRRGKVTFDALPHGITRPSPYGQYILRRVGKTKAGRLLDGREHNDMPRSL